MSITLPRNIFNLKGQVVKDIRLSDDNNCLVIHCRRNKKYKAIDPQTNRCGTINTYVRRQVKDIPMLGFQCLIEIELAQVYLSKNERRIEACAFVNKGCFYTKRFCRLISGLCRHASIAAVSNYFDLRWETVKNIDKEYLEDTLPALNPEELTDLKYIGVDEVARAKGHDYMTVVYNMGTGQLIWVETGRTSETFSLFLQALPKATATGILAVAMDMGPAYQKSVKDHLPHADIVFDRFHVMKNYSKAISNQRRMEFRKADAAGKKLIKGSKFLLLRNSDKLSEKQQNKLNKLLSVNANINIIYILKEQLQALWQNNTYEDMAKALDAWCQMADESGLAYIKRFAKSLRKNKIGICNYAKHRITSARIEAGNVGIGMIRKRARGIRDTEYFKLKIRQLSTPEDINIFFQNNKNVA